MVSKIWLHENMLVVKKIGTNIPEIGTTVPKWHHGVENWHHSLENWHHSVEMRRLMLIVARSAVVGCVVGTGRVQLAFMSCGHWLHQLQAC